MQDRLEWGVFRSEDRGHSWHMANTGLTDPFLLCLEVDQKGWVYAGTVRGGVFRTKNGGIKWEPMNKGLKTGGGQILVGLCERNICRNRKRYL